MTPYEEMQVLHKKISAVHKDISEVYRVMSKRNSEYYFDMLEKQVEQHKAKAAVLREQLKEVTRRFVDGE